jgi:hypothetical protein
VREEREAGRVALALIHDCGLRVTDADDPRANAAIIAFAEDIERLGLTRERAEQMLREEVKVWDAYIMGEVYAFDIVDEESGSLLDSCGGFYGYEAVEEAVKDALAYHEGR